MVSSAGRIQPPPDQEPLLAAGPRVIAVAQGDAEPFFYDSELSGTDVRVYVGRFADGQALQAARARSSRRTRRCGGWPRCSRWSAWPGSLVAALLGGVVGRSALAPVRG